MGIEDHWDKVTRYDEIIDAELYLNVNSIGISASIAAAKCSTHPCYMMGAAVKKGSKLLGLGYNKNKTSGYFAKKFKHNNVIVDKLHAEVSSILKCRDDLKGASIFIVRLKAHNKLGMAYPCSLCLSIIKEAGIKRVIYSGSDGRWWQKRIY